MAYFFDFETRILVHTLLERGALLGLGLVGRLLAGLADLLRFGVGPLGTAADGDRDTAHRVLGLGVEVDGLVVDQGDVLLSVAVHGCSCGSPNRRG
jgi:hypothetical protein